VDHANATRVTASHLHATRQRNAQPVGAVDLSVDRLRARTPLAPLRVRELRDLPAAADLRSMNASTPQWLNFPFRWNV
jgi:hypothetical protein